MRYIKKNPEPEHLKTYRTTTEDASYNGYNQKQITYNGNEEITNYPVREALLKEQNFLCAYCMRRISLATDANNASKPLIEIEHYETQANEPTKTLFYSNMLGVCNGHFGKIINKKPI